MAAAIEVEGLKKSYGAIDAVRDISFEVEQGEIVAVLGPNGAGKTTTVEILEGYRRRDGGRVSVLGVDPANGGLAFRQRIGIVLQEVGVDQYLTVAEVLRMYGGYYPSPRPVDEVLAVAGLEEKADSRVAALSGGQKRRLDMALGLIGDPDLLFLDEPTTGFDPSARRQAWKVIDNLGELGKTILLTTHYMDEAQSLADRVVVITAGRVVADGPPDTIGGPARTRPQIRFVLPSGLTVADLPVPATLVGTEVVVESEEPTSTLHQLTGWALERGLELADLTVARPSLEDVYLALTGTQQEQEDAR